MLCKNGGYAYMMGAFFLDPTLCYTGETKLAREVTCQLARGPSFRLFFLSGSGLVSAAYL